MIWRNHTIFLLACLLSGLASTKVGASDVADAVGAAIAGESAFQAGRYREAGHHYLRAATASADADLAARAARMAVLGGDDALLATVLARWGEIRPNDIARAGLALRLALRSGQPGIVRDEALRLLELGSEGLLEFRQSFEDLRGPALDVGRQALASGDWTVRMPRRPDAWLGLAGAARRLDLPVQASSWLTQLASLFPEDPVVLLALSSWLREQGDPEAAARTLARRGPSDVPRTEDRRRFAVEYIALSRPADAERWLASLPGEATIYRQRLGLLGRPEDREARLRLVADMRRDPRLPADQRNLLLGLAAELAEEWRLATRHYQRIAAGPMRDEAVMRQVHVLLQQERRKEALGLLRRLQGDDALAADTRRDAHALEARLLAEGPGTDAIEAYGRGLRAFAGDARLLYGRALRFVEMDRIDEGLADLEQLLRLQPRHPGALNAYGYTLAERRQRYEEALPFVELALRLQPDSAAILDSLGYIRLRQGRLEDALPLLERAWSLQPDPEIAAHLGEALWKSGRRDEAVHRWADGLALDPGNRHILAVQKDLRP